MPSNRSYVICLFLTTLSLFALSATVTAAEAVSPATNQFLWVSDIHLDPFHGINREEDKVGALFQALCTDTAASNPAAPCDKNSTQPRWRDHTTWDQIFEQSAAGQPSFPQQSVEYPWGQDTNDLLFTRMLGDAAAALPAPDFILITGDLLGHTFGANYGQIADNYLPAALDATERYNDFVQQTLKYIGLRLRTSFPNAPIYSTLGNNDAYCGDYDIHLDVTTSKFLSDTAETFLEYFLPGLSNSEKTAFEAGFAKGGYYAVTPPFSKNNRLVILNSIPFLTNYPDDYRGDSFNPSWQSCSQKPVIDATAQLDWLKQEVNTAGANPMWVAMHIPPGVDCYGSRHSTSASSDSKYWPDDKLTSFRDALFDGGAKPKNLAGIFAAHSHMSEFKILRDNAGQAASFVLMGPSISPNHSNNPSFRVVTYDRADLSISDYTTYYLDISADQDNPRSKPEHSFQFHYGQTNVSGASLQSIMNTMQSQGARGPLVTSYSHEYNTNAAGTLLPQRYWPAFQRCMSSLTDSTPTTSPR